MKKSLLALAVLGSLAAAAQAQTSVTIYGVVDAGLQYQSKTGANNNSLFAVSSGNMSGSRIGFKGTEDLGGGLKANFVLETGYTVDNGGLDGQDGQPTGVANLFRRTSTVGLAGDFGWINVGRQTDFAYSGINGGIASMSGAGTMGTFVNKNGTTQARLQGDRTNNSIRYDMPTMGGLNGGVMLGLGEQSGGGSSGQVYAAGLKYENGPLAVGGDYYQSKIGTSPADRNLSSGGVVGAAGFTSGTTATKTTTLAAAYNFGFGRLFGGWSRVTMQTGVSAASVGAAALQTFNSGAFSSTSANNKLDLYEINYTHNLTASLQLLSGYSHTKVSFINGAPQGKLNQVYIGTDYMASKRTDLYAVLAYLRTSDVVNPLAQPTASTTNVGGAYNLGVGIRHSF